MTFRGTTAADLGVLYGGSFGCHAPLKLLAGSMSSQNPSAAAYGSPLFIVAWERGSRSRLSELLKTARQDAGQINPRRLLVWGMPMLCWQAHHTVTRAPPFEGNIFGG